MIRYWLILACLLTCSFAEGAERIGLDNGSIKSYCRNVLRDKGWKVFATGRRSYKGFEQQTLFFCGAQQLSLSEARAFFVDETQKLISALNEKKRGNNSSSDPYTIMNLGYMVSFRDPFYQYRCEPYIATVMCMGDRIIYSTYNVASDRIVDIYEEPYEEAVRIVNGEIEDPFPWP